LLFLPEWREIEKVAWTEKTMEASKVVLYSLPIFFSLNLFLAIFRVSKKEREKGKWFGPRFIYSEPQLLATRLVDENDNDNPFEFKIIDAEINALVSYKIEIDRTDNRATVQLDCWGGKKAMVLDKPMHLPKGSFRLPQSRKMSVHTHVEPQSTLTTVRVYMTGWEIGKGDGRS
jgi:hypothetical protein